MSTSRSSRRDKLDRAATKASILLEWNKRLKGVLGPIYKWLIVSTAGRQTQTYNKTHCSIDVNCTIFEIAVTKSFRNDYLRPLFRLSFYLCALELVNPILMDHHLLSASFCPHAVVDAIT